MSISVRSLGILIVVIVCLAGWLVAVSASGPRSASAAVSDPFPPQAPPPAVETPLAQPAPEEPGSIEISSIPVKFSRAIDGALPVLSSRLESALAGQEPQMTDWNSSIVVFMPQRPQWRADANGDGELNETDIAEFDDLWSWADSRADFNADGVVDPDDYAAFVNSYNSSEAMLGENQLQLDLSHDRITTIRLESGGVRLQLMGDMKLMVPPAR